MDQDKGNEFLDVLVERLSKTPDFLVRMDSERGPEWSLAWNSLAIQRPDLCGDYLEATFRNADREKSFKHAEIALVNELMRQNHPATTQALINFLGKHQDRGAFIGSVRACANNLTETFLERATGDDSTREIELLGWLMDHHGLLDIKRLGTNGFRMYVPMAADLLMDNMALDATFRDGSVSKETEARLCHRAHQLFGLVVERNRSLDEQTNVGFGIETGLGLACRGNEECDGRHGWLVTCLLDLGADWKNVYASTGSYSRAIIEQHPCWRVEALTEVVQQGLDRGTSIARKPKI